MIRSATSKAVAGLVAASIGLAAFTPIAFAAGPGRGDMDGHRRMEMHRQGGMAMGGRGGLLGLSCGPNGAERIEHALVALNYRVNPTGEQVQLFDALKTSALAAQAEFAATCEATLPAAATASADATAAAPADATTRPNMLEALQMRVKLDEARVAALGDVLPQFEAFFNSLTDEQKAALELRVHDRADRGPGQHDRRGPGRGMDRSG